MALRSANIASLMAAIERLARPPRVTDTVSHELQMDELLGHLRGAYTSAVNESCFEAAAMEQSYRPSALKFESLNRGLDAGGLLVFANLQTLLPACGHDVHFCYASILFQLLLALHVFLCQAESVQVSTSKGIENKTESQPQFLSIRETMAVHVATQTAVIWGIEPYLGRGIGVLVRDRITDEMRQKLPVLFAAPVSPYTLSNEQRELRLLYSTRTCAPIICGQSEVSETMRGACLNDFTMALCDIVYRSKPDPTDRILWSSMEVKRACASILAYLCRNISPDLTLEAFSVALTQRECPSWLKTACTRYLSVCLCVPGGVHALLTQMLDTAQTDETVELVCAKATRVVCTYPQWMSSPESYFVPICRQLHHLMHLRIAVKGELTRKISKATMHIVYNLFPTQTDTVRQYLFRDLICKPLACFTVIVSQDSLNPSTHDDNVVVEENALQLCVEDLHKIFCMGPQVVRDPSASRHISIISEWVPALFYLYCFSRKTISNLRTSCQEVLSAYFRAIDNQKGTEVLLDLVLPPTADENQKRPFTEQYFRFAAGDNGGVVIKRETEDMRDYAWEADSVAELLGTLKRNELAGDFFVVLIDEFIHVMENEQSLLDPIEPRTNRAVFLGTAEDEQEDATSTGKRYMALVQCAMKLVEKLDVSILKNVRHVVVFAKMLAGSPEAETISLALGLLTAMLSGGVEICQEDEAIVADLHGWLEPYIHHPNDELREMALDLRTSIRTRDPDWNTLNIEHLQRNIQPAAHDFDASSSAHEPMYNVKITDMPPKPQSRLASNSTASDIVGSKPTLATVLADLRNVMLPVRAHAIITLRSLITDRDPSTFDNIDKICDILQSNVRQSDSYLYLNAIHGLVDMACVYPVPTIKNVCASFSDLSLAEDDRLKFGEVISKLIDQCHKKVLQPYINELLDVLLRVLRRDGTTSSSQSTPESAFIHASAFASLALLCEQYGIVVHTRVKDIVLCINEAMQTYMDDEARPIVMEMPDLADNSTNKPSRNQPPTSSKSTMDNEEDEEAVESIDERCEVRRGAMHVLALMFRGLGTTTIGTMAPYLKSTLQLLRRTASSDPDDITRAHAQIALEELDVVVFQAFGLQRVGDWHADQITADGGTSRFDSP